MRRTTIALVIVTAISCAASVVFAAGWMGERPTLHSVRAQLAAMRREVAVRPSVSATAGATATPIATATPEATPTGSTSHVTCPAASSATATAPAASPAYPQIQSVADNLGRIWFPYDQSTVKVGTAFCFTVKAIDPLNRPLQYKVWTGDRPNESLVCDWGGPSCRWTALQPSGVNYTPYNMRFSIAARTSDSAHRLSNGACFRDDACDAVTWIQFTLD